MYEGVPDIIANRLINSPTDGSCKVIIVLSTILSATYISACVCLCVVRSPISHNNCVKCQRIIHVMMNSVT